MFDNSIKLSIAMEISGAFVQKKVPRLPIHIQILTNAAKSYNIKQMHCLSRFGFVLALIKFIEKHVSIKQMHCQNVLLMYLMNVASYCECLSFFCGFG